MRAFSKNIDTDQIEKLRSDDYALPHFYYYLLIKLCLMINTFKECDRAYEKRIEDRGEIIKMRQQAEYMHLMTNTPRYKPDEKVKDEDLQ